MRGGSRSLLLLGQAFSMMLDQIVDFFEVSGPDVLSFRLLLALFFGDDLGLEALVLVSLVDLVKCVNFAV